MIPKLVNFPRKIKGLWPTPSYKALTKLYLILQNLNEGKNYRSIQEDGRKRKMVIKIYPNFPAARFSPFLFIIVNRHNIWSIDSRERVLKGFKDVSWQKSYNHMKLGLEEDLRPWELLSRQHDNLINYYYYNATSRSSVIESPIMEGSKQHFLWQQKDGV